MILWPPNRIDKITTLIIKFVVGALAPKLLVVGTLAPKLVVGALFYDKPLLGHFFVGDRSPLKM
jgi:hypothetical protein